MLHRRTLLALGLGCAAALAASPSRAVDTLETFDPGALDVELYTGHEGLGLSSDERTVFADALVGYGLVDRLSVYLGSSTSATGGGDERSLCPYAGVFGTPLASDHVDLDLALDLGVDDEQNFVAGPAVELNYDDDPEMRTWGLFAHASITLCRKARTLQKSMDIASQDATWSFGVAVGAYAMVAPGHQVLVESDVALRPDPEEDERGVELGGVALGYNTQLSDTAEWLSQGYLDVPQSGETTSYGLLTGLILTLD